MALRFTGDFDFDFNILTAFIRLGRAGPVRGRVPFLLLLLFDFDFDFDFNDYSPARGRYMSNRDPLPGALSMSITPP